MYIYREIKEKCKYNDVDNQLFFINRETKNYFCSDVQRECFDYDDKLYKFNKEWSEKFWKKDLNKYSKDLFNHILLEKTSNTPRLEPFQKTLGLDVRDIQDAEDSPMYMFKIAEKENPKTDFKIKLISADKNDWNFKIKEFLKELFAVKDVYTCFPRISEYRKRTILTKSSFIFDLIHFNIDQKIITQEENYQNRKLRIWLFKDFLVFQMED